MADVTTHTNIVRPDRMALLTESDRIPERLTRLERAVAEGASASDSVVYEWPSDSASSVVLSDLSRLAQDKAWEFIFVGAMTGGGLYIRPNSSAVTAEYMNRRHRHYQTDLAAGTGHDIQAAAETTGLMMSINEWSVENSIISRGLLQKVTRGSIGTPWMADWTVAPINNQNYMLRVSNVGKWWSASTITSLQIWPTGTVRAGSRLVIRSAERGIAGPKGDTGAASTVPGPQGNQGIQGVPGGIESYEQASQPNAINNGAIWIDTDEEPPTYVKPFLTPIVTVLPASPYDGQEVYYQTTAMEALGLCWHLRYRAASSSIYKWEVIGGAPLVISGATGGTIPTSGYVVLGGMTWAVPLAGIYIVAWGGQMSAGSGAGAYSSVTLYNNNVSTNYRAVCPVYAVTYFSLSTQAQIEVVTAGHVVEAKAIANVSSGVLVYPHFSVQPVRVK